MVSVDQCDIAGHADMVSVPVPGTSRHQLARHAEVLGGGAGGISCTKMSSPTMRCCILQCLLHSS